MVIESGGQGGRWTNNGDGTYTDFSGNIRDKWGNTWNSSTGQWYNSGGEQWMGTNPANGTGIFGPANSYINTQGNVVSGAGGLDLSGIDLSGGGGGGTVDHYMDVNPLDQATFDANQKQQVWQNDFDQAKFAWQKAQDDRNYALAVGDLDLARQKQADANYWQGKTLEAQQAMNAADNASAERRASISAGAQVTAARLDAESKIQAATIAAQADRYAADLRLREGLANAQNDADRNRVLLAHEQEVAQIAKMEDDTKRAIAAQEHQISGFNAETARAAQMGDIALKNNQFILDASKSPRDLFGLYFMQRGLTPDWNTLANGGQLAQGDPLKIYDPMKAYVPTITMPQNFTLGAGPSYGKVGGASNFSIGPNQFITGGAGGSGGGTTSSYGGQTQVTQNARMQPSAPQQQMQPEPNPMIQHNLGDAFVKRAVVPMVSSYASGTDFVDYNIGHSTPTPQFGYGVQQYDQRYINQAMNGDPKITNPSAFSFGISQSNQTLNSRPQPQPPMGTSITNRVDFGAPTQGWISNPANPAPNGRVVPAQQQQPAHPQTMPGPQVNSSAQVPIQMPYNIDPKDISRVGDPSKLPINKPQPEPGFTTADRFMTGDAPHANPWAGGARPEMIENPTNAPIRVLNTEQTANQMGDSTPQWDYINNRPQMAHPFFNYLTNQMEPGQAWNYLDPSQLFNPNGLQRQIFDGDPATMAWDWLNSGRYANGTDIARAADIRDAYMMHAGIMGMYPRHAMGTDVSQDYANLGMGSLYLQSSNNDHLQGAELPKMLGGLAGAGMPIAPSLFANATGRNVGYGNTSSAFNQRGGGVLPSLQTLNTMSPGETELFRGYGEGVVGIPWADIVDYLGKPTQNLGTAQRARGGLF